MRSSGTVFQKVGIVASDNIAKISDIIDISVILNDVFFKMKIDLRNFRNKNGLSQKDLANIFGSGQANISMIENTNRDLTPEQYGILCKKFGESEVLKYVIVEDQERRDPVSMSISVEAWEMIKHQIQIIKDQQETIKSQQKTIEFFAKKVGSVQNVQDANVG